MSMKSTKLLAAAVLLTCGLGLGVGSRWVSSADAQPPGPTAGRKTDLAAEVKRLQAEIDQLRLLAEADAALSKASQRSKKEEPTFTTRKWEYDLVVVSKMSQLKFQAFLQDREDRGWEYNGTTVMADPEQTVWVFRRPVKTDGSSNRVYWSTEPRKK